MASDIVVGLVALTVSVGLLSGFAAWSVLRRFAPERRRLRQIAVRHDAVRQDALARWRDSVALPDRRSALAERICRVMPRTPARMGEMRQKLVAAGYRSLAAPTVYAASQIVCALISGALLGFATGNGPVGILGMVAGFALPGVWLSSQVKRRARIIRNGLPDVLDLLIICLESGAGLDQALVKSGEELGLAYKPLSDELALMSNEIRAGMPRTEAFTNLADRTGVDDVRSLVAMLVQTDRYGTSIGQALRGHADLLRTRRRQRAEERASKAGVKLVFPLVLCLFPAFYILTLGPALLRFARIFADAVSGLK
ncbi:MAG TPA: type II secretion system F family protein [Vicinamibacterales bacterium]|jgi:tight adherence protein C|nr:type II secretion system F family protein [Vicinamibacterales bacterium]